ncbi:MAG: YcaO-like family protein, partial [Terriglobales bacterium]
MEVIPKRFCAGTHRACAPSETLRRVRPLLGAMGITRVGNITGLDHIGIPVAIAVRPNARSLAVAAGKGATWPAAQVSALMEAVETHHAEHIELPLARASARELERKRAVVEIETLPQMPGAGVSRDSRLLWLDGYDLMQEETVAVPYEAVSLDFTLPGMAGGGVFAASSNGLASGNHRLEAISHALNEVIERDALALWSAQGADARNRTRVQRASVDDALCRAMLERCERAGVEATIWNITSAV